MGLYSLAMAKIPKASGGDKKSEKYKKTALCEFTQSDKRTMPEQSRNAYLSNIGKLTTGYFSCLLRIIFFSYFRKDSPQAKL